MSSSSGGTTISGTLQSVANTTFRVELFANAAMDPSGYGQGQTYLGFATVSTGIGGNASFTATFATVVPRGYFISATATNLSTGDTSQFSKDLVVGSFLVTNTNDSGAGSLRAAIVDANTLADGTAANPDQIQFDIPTTDPGYNSTTGAFTNQPLSALPTVTDTVVIDGYTQPGASPNTLTVGDNAVLNIVLSGSLAGAVDGLVITAGNCTVGGLVIDNYAEGSGVVLNGSGSDVVTGNFIGTDVTGESPAANNIGINSNSPGDTIGGPAPADRNIISGNDSALPDSADGGSNPAGFGIAPGNANMIEGNYIGTDKSGTSALPNYFGINGGSNITIGGLTGSPGTGAGNVISGNAFYGIGLSKQNLVAGNVIGTNATGLAALGNGFGIHVVGNNNTIGGTTAGARNIISGNDGNGSCGINIENQADPEQQGSYNLVRGNYIGTDITGTTNLGRQDNGILIYGAYNTIGGTTAAARNIISGNGNGISINSAGRPANSPSNDSFGNAILGDYIGTDPSGTLAVPNSTGIQLVGGTYGNTIGGTLSGEGNLISGNGDGIDFNEPTNNLVQGNLIGTDKTGTAALGNRDDGIDIYNGANNNTIGGTAPGAGNVIAFNSGNGVEVDSGTGNSILGNSISSNGGPVASGSLGIFLNSANNANDNQAFPVLTSVSSSSSGTTISGTLQSVASSTFRVELFANAAMDPSGDGQGQTYLGFATVSTDAGGNASFTATLSTVVPRGYFISATATNLSTGDTSQFSKDLVVGSFLVTNTNDSGGGSLRAAIVDANTLADGTAAKPDQIQFDIPTTDPGYQSGTGAFTIQPLSALPTITDTFVLDGYTQPGASPNTLAIGDNAVLKIVLNGSLAGSVDGLVIAGGSSTVSGLVIDNFAAGAADGGGGLVLGGGNDVVTGNFIGTDVTGESAAPNSNGIYTTSPGNMIGGPSPADRNIISGNNSAQPVHFSQNGIALGSNGNLIEGNYIGTDKSGTSALGNSTGIFGGSNNTIGGLTATPGIGAGNVISGNPDNGIFLTGGQSLVAGNLIGTTATGLAALGNGQGIYLWSNNNTIGGTTAGARNIVSGNTYGVDIENVSPVAAAGGSYNVVEGNYIGTDITGTTRLGKQLGIIIYGAYNTIGGTTAAARNIISGNDGDGIQINSSSAGFLSFQPLFWQ